MVTPIFMPPMDGNNVNASLAHFRAARSALALHVDEPAHMPIDLVFRVFEAAAFAGLDAWTALMLDDELARLESMLTSPASLLAVYEQELLAPSETGLRERALMLIESMGHRDELMARDVERLLHAAGESKAAYRVEHGRRGERPRRAPEPRSTMQLSRLAIVVAGGHPRLRKMIGRDLARDGLRDFREIPSKFEASRVGRDVAAKLGGADLAVVIASQIAHSTSEQVTAAAAKLEAPVAFSHSASIAGVRREVEAFAAKRGEP